MRNPLLWSLLFSALPWLCRHFCYCIYLHIPKRHSLTWKLLAFVDKWQHQPTTDRRQVHLTASEILGGNLQRWERQVNKTVSRLMSQGKVKSTLSLLLKSEGMVLDVSCPAGDGDTQTVFDVLKEKHPSCWSIRIGCTAFKHHLWQSIFGCKVARSAQGTSTPCMLMLSHKVGLWPLISNLVSAQ